MAESPTADGAMPTREQAAQIAARFLVYTPHAPRLLTTREVDQIQSLIATCTKSDIATDQSLGFWLERVLEGAMAISGRLAERESLLRGAEAQLAQVRTMSPATAERLEQLTVVARVAERFRAQQPEECDAVLDELRIPHEDFLAAVAELTARAS